VWCVCVWCVCVCCVCVGCVWCVCVCGVCMCGGVSVCVCVWGGCGVWCVCVWCVCGCVCVWCVCVKKDVICPSWHTKLFSAQWLLRVTTEFCILPRDVINLLVTNVATLPDRWTVSFKWLVFIKEKDCVLCDLGSLYLRIIQTNLRIHQRLRDIVDATIRQPITTKSRVKSRDLLLVKLPPSLSHPLSAPYQK